MAPVRPVPLKGEAMLRLVLLVLYLIASSSASRTPPLPTSDAGSGYDPNDASFSPPTAPTADSGGGYDPNG